MIKVVHKTINSFLGLNFGWDRFFYPKLIVIMFGVVKMRIAILSVTDTGFELAKKISSQIGGYVFCKGRDFDSLKNFVAVIFGKFDALIFICAAGIAVRVIAPLIVNKLSDPAVIVMDERGQNVISLLSGHVGGANELTLKIAAALNANPVITTATDVENKFAVDTFAAKFGLIPTPKDAIKIINSAVLRDEEIYLTAGNRTIKISADQNNDAVKIINSAVLNDEKIFITAGNARLNLKPKKLIAGIGCKRGTSAEKIFSAVFQACKMINQPLERIKLLASVDIKSDECGLLKFANELNIEIKFFSVEELAKKIADYKLSESEFVKATIGVGNVCEAAALCCVKSARFALTKQNFDGVTVCLIWEK